MAPIKNWHPLIFVSLFTLVIAFLAIDFGPYSNPWPFVTYYLIFLRTLILYLAVVLVIARIIARFSQTALLYVLTGWFNLVFGLFALLCFLLDHQWLSWLQYNIFNLVAALVILTDRYLLSKVPQ